MFILCIASLRMAVWATETCRSVPHIKTISLVYILVLCYIICAQLMHGLFIIQRCVFLCRCGRQVTTAVTPVELPVNVGRNAAPEWSLRLHVLDHFA